MSSRLWVAVFLVSTAAAASDTTDDRIREHRDSGSDGASAEDDTLPRSPVHGPAVRGLFAQVLRLRAAGGVRGSLAEGRARGGLLGRGGPAVRPHGDAVDRRRQRVLRNHGGAFASSSSRGALMAHRARSDRVWRAAAGSVAGKGGARQSRQQYVYELPLGNRPDRFLSPIKARGRLATRGCRPRPPALGKR